MNQDDSLTLKNYKMPLKAVPPKEGYGYYGAILVTKDGVGIQCHLCGGVMGDLSGHIRFKHASTVKEYREKFELSPTTSLISESVRMARKDATLEWLSSMSEEDKAEHQRNALAKYREWMKNRKGHNFKITLETKNKRGSCPDQLLDKIQQVADFIGHTPSLVEFMEETGGQRFKHLIFKQFGSWSKALEHLGLRKETRRKGTRRQYTDEELIELLRLYQHETGKEPTSSDCKRGLLPPWDVFKRHFGSFVRAKKVAAL